MTSKSLGLFSHPHFFADNTSTIALRNHFLCGHISYSLCIEAEGDKTYKSAVQEINVQLDRRPLAAGK